MIKAILLKKIKSGSKECFVNLIQTLPVTKS